MRALSLDAPGKLRMVSLADPLEPGPAEALIRIRQVGICGTDYHAFHGNQPFFTYPRILGHELGVEVVAVGTEVHHLVKGDHCAVRPYLACGSCPACRRGKPNCCMHLQVFGVHVDGGLREFALLPAASLHPARTLTFEQLALVEPLAIGAHAVAGAEISKGERVLVVGVGPIGLAVTQFALLAGAQVIVTDISQQRLAFCQNLWPTVTGIDGREPVVVALEHLLGDDLPTAIFDATGNPQSMQATFTYVGYGGRVIFVGLSQKDITFSDPLFHSREVALLASRNALAADFDYIIAALEADEFNLAPWITHHATLETAEDAFSQWSEVNSVMIKGLISI
ncbi:MAG TPA: zinc-binding alcohol dehydrogenase family protein [Ktedonobacteraceae bacterium]|nr:zinc-binding alcohol dehydrogenase family protein [Ktedonobacteraceae bacterium]